MSLQRRLLCSLHYATWAEHLDGISMYKFELREYYCPYMENQIHMTVKDCQQCAHKQPNGDRRIALQLFPPSSALGSVAMHILELVPKTLTGNYLILVMKALYTKLTRSVLIFIMTRVKFASMFMDNGINWYRILTHVLTNHRTQFRITFWNPVRLFMY